MANDAAAAQAVVYLIRHAEKPCTDAAGTAFGGIDDQGNADPESLIPRGWVRAGAWAAYFGPGGQMASPQRIYASNDVKTKDAADDKTGSHSKRPTETVTALSQRLLDAAPDTRFGKGQEAALAAEIATLSGVTLVCWQHEAIPAIAKWLAPGIGFPDPWPGDRFDVAWRLKRTAAGGAWTFDQLRPQLLPGDSGDPI